MTSDQKAALNQNRILIGDNINRETFLYIREAVFQKVVEGSPRLVIHISSNGGEVTPGLDTCDILGLYQGEKVAIVHGLAASMASVILQMCDWRTATAHSRILIHHVSSRNVSLDTIRDPVKMKKFVEGMEEDQTKLYQILMSKSKKNLEQIRGTCELDTSMPAHEALSYGLIDQIIVKEAEINYPPSAEVK